MGRSTRNSFMVRDELAPSAPVASMPTKAATPATVTRRETGSRPPYINSSPPPGQYSAQVHRENLRAVRKRSRLRGGRRMSSLPAVAAGLARDGGTGAARLLVTVGTAPHPA